MSDLAKGIGLLFLTVSANFTGDLLSCQTRRTLHRSVYARHIIGILLLAFFVVIVDSDTYTRNAKQGKWLVWPVLLNTMLMYALFMALAKTDLILTLPIIALLLVVLILGFEASNKDEATQAMIEQVKTVTTVAAAIMLAFGVYRYYKRQKKEHTNFSFHEFWFGIGCDLDKPDADSISSKEDVMRTDA